MRNIGIGAVVGLLLVQLSACRTGDEGGVVSGRLRLAAPEPPAISFALRTEGLSKNKSWMWKCDPVFADVNGDGLLDLAAIPRMGDGPHVWLGDGDGHWTDSSAGLGVGKKSCGGGVGLADVNRDGLLDLVAADHCQGVSVFLGDGQGHWEAVAESIHPEDLVPAEPDRIGFLGAEDVAIGDFNSDGHMDFVACASDEGGINLYLGDGTGKNWTRLATSLPTSGWVNRVMAVDVSGDGRLDVVAALGEGLRVWLGDGDGGFTASSAGLPTPIIEGLFTGLAAGDVNGDGLVDVVAANWVGGPEVHLQQSDGSWEKTPDVFPDMLGGAYGVAVGDIDRDGHLDMVVSGWLSADKVGYIYGVFCLLGDGHGGWAYTAHSNLPETGLAFTFGVALGDFDGDGMLDIAAGTGGIVATDQERQEPVLPLRLLAWAARVPGARTARANER